MNNLDIIDNIERIATAVEPSIKRKLYKIAYKYSMETSSSYAISIMPVNGVIMLTANNTEIYKSLPIAIYNEDRNIMEWVYNDINNLYKENIDDNFVYTFNNEYLSPFCIENNIPYITCSQKDRREID